MAALLILSVLVVQVIGSPELTSVAVTGLIEMIAVIGLYVFVGNSGIVSFGQVGFMGIGAYAGALLTVPPELKSAILPNAPSIVEHWHVGSPVLSALIAGLACAVLALVVGAPLMRLSGMAASIATMALLIIAYSILNNWTAVTDGPGTLAGIPGSLGLVSAGAWTLGALTVAYIYQMSRSALRLRATREDPLAANASGVITARERLLAFVLSALIMGVAGALYGSYLGSLAPSSFYFDTTFLYLVMLVVGGVRSLTGAVFGTIIVVAGNQELLQLESGFHIASVWVPGRPGAATLVLAVVLLAMLIRRPGGLVGDHELRLSGLWQAARERRSAPSRPTSRASNPQGEPDAAQASQREPTLG